jgi:GNAT superfamily N-acetyltransferase
MNPSVEIRPAHLEEEALIADHFYQMWLDNAITPEMLIADWRAEVIRFIQQARRELAYQAFVAVINHRIVGSVGCQRFAGLYPTIFQPTYRCDGYIWGVYVEPESRHQGIGQQLTQRSLLYLQSIGCTHAVLNASPFGKALYEHLGFTASNLMRISLSEQPES